MATAHIYYQLQNHERKPPKELNKSVKLLDYKLMLNNIRSIQDPTAWLADEEEEKEELNEIRRAEYQAKKELEQEQENNNKFNLAFN